MGNTGTSAIAIAELREFAGFSPCEQRYIKRSLDVGLGRQDAFKLWARDAQESSSIRSWEDLDKPTTRIGVTLGTSLDKNITAMIWCGKQLLGQTDKAQVRHTIEFDLSKLSTAELQTFLPLLEKVTPDDERHPQLQ